MVQTSPIQSIDLFADWLSDEPPLETDLHREQIDLLIRLLKWCWREKNDFYVSGNTTVYYSPDQRTNRDFKGPDFYVVLDTEKKDRSSWMVWKEAGKYPNLVIELLSDSTKEVDRTLKKALYETTWRVPDYFWFHPNTLEFRGFHLLDNAYVELLPNADGWLWSNQLGMYLGILNQKLRLFTTEGQLVLLEEEAMRIRVAEEQQRVERLAERLRQLGVNPDGV
jgi:Uma2 family endonuclease